MKNTIALTLFLFMGFCLNGQELKKAWERNTLEAPESVVLHEATSKLYVSNVSGQPAEKNGMGFISLLNLNGEIISKKWLTGLNAPKGMAIHDNKLYIADIDKVVVADLNSGSILNEYQAEGATFLNDVAVDKEGVVYITDTFGGNAIYKLENGEISVWIKDDKLNYPNGLYINEGNLYVSTWGVVTNPETFETEVPGVLLGIDIASKQIQEITSPFGNLDGLQWMKDGFLVSDWIAGGLLKVNKGGQVEQIMDLKSGSADILYMEDKNLLLVPQMLDGALTAYTVAN